MSVVNVTLGDGKKLNLPLGRQGENEVTAVVFDFSAWSTEFGSGTLSLSVQRHGDELPYAVTMTTSGTNATWTISDLDTAYKGTGEAQVKYTVGTKVKKSAVYKFTVNKSLGQNGEYPSPGQTWQEEIEDELDDVKQDLGDLSELETEAKSDLVSAINEAAQNDGIDNDMISSLLAFCQHVAMLTDDSYLYEDLETAWAKLKPTGIEIDSEMYVEMALSEALTTTLIPDGAVGVVSYVSDDEDVATVDSNGNVTGGLKLGNATITASVNGHSDTCEVTNNYPEIHFFMGNNNGYNATTHAPTYGNSRTDRGTSYISHAVNNQRKIADPYGLFSDDRFLLPIPKGATSVKVTCPNLYFCVTGYKYDAEQNCTSPYDAGWVTSLFGGGTYALTQELSADCTHINIGFKNSNSTSIMDYDITQLAIEFE